MGYTPSWEGVSLAPSRRDRFLSALERQIHRAQQGGAESPEPKPRGNRLDDWDSGTQPATAGGARWVSAADAADAAGVTPRAVRSWAEAGYIVSQRSQGISGELVMVRLDEVLAHVGKSRGEAGAATSEGGAEPGVGPLTTPTTSELAPLLKAIPELMSQLTAATDRAARAETKLEFLSGQVTNLKEQLEETEARATAAAAAAADAERLAQAESAASATPLETAVESQSGAAQTPAVEREREPEPELQREPEPEPEPDVRPESRAEVHVEETPEGETFWLPESQPVSPPPPPPAPDAVDVTDQVPTPTQSEGAAAESGDEDADDDESTSDEAVSPEELFKDFLRRVSEKNVVRETVQAAQAPEAEPEERFRQGFLKGVSAAEGSSDESASASGSGKGPWGDDKPAASRSSGPAKSEAELADAIWGPPAGESDGGAEDVKPEPYLPTTPPPKKRRWWGKRR